MIGFFPVPYPDELLYSACARYGKRTNYPNKRHIIGELFGGAGFSAMFDFPNRLEAFLSSFPPHNYTTDRLIDRNTLLPFHQSFLSIEKAEQIRREMKFASSNCIRTRLGLNIPQVKFPEYLRFCPLCVANDRENHGETYWHRIHQPSGVLVCAEHNCFLQDSLIGMKRQTGAVFHCAEKSLNIETPRFLSADDPEHELFLYLAKNAEWLFAQENLSLEEGVIRERYHNLLLKRGYAFYNGRVRVAELYEAFNSHFSLLTLEKLGCSLISPQRCWLTKIVGKYRSDICHHPIRHLLLMHFLGVTAEEFFTAFIEYKPFGDGPYPCLNKASDHYGELKIESCKIFDNVVWRRRGKPLGVFTCDCKFVYQRVGPDNSEEDRLKFSRVKEYGKVWERKLEELWMNLRLSISEIASILDVTPLLVVRHAIRLNLPMNEPNSRSNEGYGRHRNPNKTFDETRLHHRRNWLGILEKHPTATRKQLKDIAVTPYLWLRRNDPDWLDENLPKAVSNVTKRELIDWSEIDDEMSVEVKYVCRKILDSVNPILRVGITEIIRRTGNKTWLEKRDQKLPKTAEIINCYTETMEDFILRKIGRIEEEFIKERTIASRSGFIERAGLKNSTSKNSIQIQNAINAALMKIRLAATGEDMSLLP